MRKKTTQRRGPKTTGSAVGERKREVAKVVEVARQAPEAAGEEEALVNLAIDGLVGSTNEAVV